MLIGLAWLAIVASQPASPERIEEAPDFRRTPIGTTGWRLDEGSTGGEYVCRVVRPLGGDYREIRLNYDISDPALWLGLDGPPRRVPTDPAVIEPMTTPPSFQLSVTGLPAATPSAWRSDERLEPGLARYSYSMRVKAEHSGAMLDGRPWRISDDEGFALSVDGAMLEAARAALDGCADRELSNFAIDAADYRANRAMPVRDVLVFSSGDYPSRALREELEGTSRAMLTVDADGRVTSCAIVQTSGHAMLDEATCRVMTRRMRFDEGADGRPYLAMAVKWQLAS